MTLRLGLNTMGPTANFGIWGAGAQPSVEMVRLAESLGYDSVWTAEASGTDAVVPLAWLAANTSTIKVGTAVMQMAARSPAATAMTAVTLDNLSRGRFILGLGVSGPGVVEGWHSQAYGDPIRRSREYVDVIRRITGRRVPVEHHGEYYDIPYTGLGATGLATPIQLMIRSRRPRIPLYLAAMGPRNLKLASEVADGILLPLYSPFREDAFYGDLRERFRDGKREVAPFVPVCMADDTDDCIVKLKPVVAFWIGGMGSGGLNFYNNYARRIGFERAATEVAELYRSGQRGRAAYAIPDELVDEVSLCGPPERIKDRLVAWRESSVTTLILTGASRDAMIAIAEMASG